MITRIDEIIIAAIGLSLVTGFIRGFLKEVLSLGIWILAAFLALKYANVLNPKLQAYIQNEWLRTIAAMGGIFLATLIAGGLLNLLLGIIVKHSGLSSMDRILGMAFGVLRGIVIVAVVMVAIKLTSLPVAKYRQDSMLYAQFDPVVNRMQAYIPDLLQSIKKLEEGRTRINMAANKLSFVEPLRRDAI